MTSQLPDPRISLVDEELEAFVLSGFAYSVGYKNKTEIHANASRPLDRLIQSSSETLFEYYWPLTLSKLM